MKTHAQMIAERGIDEKKEAAKLARRSRHGWKTGGLLRVFPGQPQKMCYPGFSALEGEKYSTSYTTERAESDLLRIAAAPDQMAEYIAIYCTRNKLK